MSGLPTTLPGRIAADAHAAPDRPAPDQAGPATQCRDALTRASLNSLASALPVELLAALARERLWPIGQAQAVANRIADPARRAAALAALVPYASAADLDDLQADAVRAAREVGDERARSLTFARLLDRLPPHARGAAGREAVADARRIADPVARADALAAQVPHLPQRLADAALHAALQAARAIPFGASRSEALVRVARLVPVAERLAVVAEAIASPYFLAEVLPAIPRDSDWWRVALLDEVLRAAWALDRGDLPAGVLVAMAPVLQPRTRFLGDALRLAGVIGDPTARSQALQALKLPVPDPYRLGVLRDAVVAARAIWPDHARALALTALARQLPEGEQHCVLAEALEAIRGVVPARERTEGLCVLAPLVEAAPRAHVLAEAVRAARSIHNDRDRAQALALVAVVQRRADRLGTLREAASAAWHVGDRAARWRAVGALARYLPDDLLARAAKAVLHLRDGVAKADALATLFPDDFPARATPATRRIRDEAVRAALASARAVRDRLARGRALAALVSLLAEAERGPAAEEALWLALDERHRAAPSQAAADLAPYLPLATLGGLARADGVVADPFHRCRALAALASRLPAGDPRRSHALGDGVRLAGRCLYDDDQGLALEALAPSLAGPPLEKALAAARALRAGGPRCRALAALAQRLDPADRRAVMCEAVDAAACARHEAVRADGLARLAPLLAGGPLDEAVRVARLLLDVRARCRAVAALAPHLPGDRRAAEMGAAVAAVGEVWLDDVRAQALAALAPALGPVQMEPALEVASGIVDVRYRASALAAVLARQAEACPGDVAHRWPELVALLGRCPRPEALGVVPFLVPIFHALAGAQARGELAELAEAIAESGRAWG